MWQINCKKWWAFRVLTNILKISPLVIYLEPFDSLANQEEQNAFSLDTCTVMRGADPGLRIVGLQKLFGHLTVPSCWRGGRAFIFTYLLVFLVLFLLSTSYPSCLE